jgi:hypothetical protein
MNSFFTNTDIYTRMRTHPYEHTHAHHTHMSTSERLAGLIFRFTKSVTKNGSLSMATSPSTKILISRKCNTHVKCRI